MCEATTQPPATARPTAAPNRAEPPFRIRFYYQHTLGEAGSSTHPVFELSNRQLSSVIREIKAEVARRKEVSS